MLVLFPFIDVDDDVIPPDHIALCLCYLPVSMLVPIPCAFVASCATSSCLGISFSVVVMISYVPSDHISLCLFLSPFIDVEDEVIPPDHIALCLCYLHVLMSLCLTICYASIAALSFHWWLGCWRLHNL